MNKHLRTVLLFAAAIAMAASAIAQTNDKIAPSQTQGTSAATDTAAMTDGEVRKVDKKAGKVTIKHGPLTNLGMPGMTMAFRVKDPAMIEQVKKGDKIKFVADKIGGTFTVTKLENVK